MASSVDVGKLQPAMAQTVSNASRTSSGRQVGGDVALADGERDPGEVAAAGGEDRARARCVGVREQQHQRRDGLGREVLVEDSARSSSLGIPAVSRVIAVGMTALTLMPASAPSHAIEVVNPITEDFATT